MFQLIYVTAIVQNEDFTKYTDMTDWDILINTDSVNIFVIMYERMNFLLHMQGTMIKKNHINSLKNKQRFSLKGIPITHTRL